MFEMDSMASFADFSKATFSTESRIEITLNRVSFPFQLPHDQAVVQVLVCHQLIMSSSFFNRAGINSNNDISSPDSGEPVSNNNCGSSSSCIIQSTLDNLLTFSVKSRSCFVKKKNLRIADKCPCNCNPLLLPSRELGSTFAHCCIVSIRKLHYKVISICFFAGTFNFFISSMSFTKSNVFFNRKVEQYWFLTHHTYLIP